MPSRRRCLCRHKAAQIACRSCRRHGPPPLFLFVTCGDVSYRFMLSYRRTRLCAMHDHVRKANVKAETPLEREWRIVTSSTTMTSEMRRTDVTDIDLSEYGLPIRLHDIHTTVTHHRLRQSRHSGALTTRKRVHGFLAIFVTDAKLSICWISTAGSSSACTTGA